MAEQDDKKFSPIEKALPNIQNLDLDKEDVAVEQEIVVEGQEQPDGEPQITETADGGVEVNFDPNQVNPQNPEDPNANLAESLPENVLGPLGSMLFEKQNDYKMSRKDWVGPGPPPTSWRAPRRAPWRTPTMASMCIAVPARRKARRRP